MNIVRSYLAVTIMKPSDCCVTTRISCSYMLASLLSIPWITLANPTVKNNFLEQQGEKQGGADSALLGWIALTLSLPLLLPTTQQRKAARAD